MKETNCMYLQISQFWTCVCTP